MRAAEEKRSVERTRDAKHLAWIDLEMTGLNPACDVILQAALIVTTSDLSILEEYSCDVWQPETALANMSPFVRDMHTATGLLKRVRQSRVDVLTAERALLERVSGWCSFPAVLCGNSIGQDRRFLERYMPGLSGFLHYRMLDVTTVKLLAQGWYGDAALYVKPEAGSHDALVDIHNSIAELAHYRKSLFRA
jgi:oligoribonuclease